MTLSLSKMLKNKVFEQHVKDAISVMDKNTKKYIDDNDYVNIMPRIGYYNDTKYPVSGTYNMSATTGYSASITDAYGRDIVYFQASDGVNAYKWYRAYRFSDDADYTYENIEIHPGYLDSNIYVNDIRGISSEYIIIETSDYKWQLVKTNGQEPVDWTLVKDISGIIKDAAHTETYNFMILKNGSVIGVYGADGLKRRLNLYRTSNLSLIKAVELSPAQPFTKPDSWDYNDYAVYNHFRGAILYNPVVETLRIFDDWRIRWNHTNHYYSTQRTWNITEDKLCNGDFSGVQPNIQLPIPADTIYGADRVCCMTTTSKTFSNVAYDDYTKQVFINYVDWDDYKAHLIKQKATANTSNPWIENQENIFCKYFIAPDACAWAKRIYPNGLIMNGNIYIEANSKKYGEHRTVNVGYETKYENGSRRLKTIPGEWFITDSYEPSSYFKYDNVVNLLCRKNGSDIKWYAQTKNAGYSYEITYNDVTINNKVMHGVRTLGTATSKLSPELPKGYTLTNRWYFDPVANRYYGFAIKPVAISDRWRYGHAFVALTYDTELHEKEITDSVLYNRFYDCENCSTNHIVTEGIYPFGSALIDDDNSFYCILRMCYNDNAGSYVVKMTANADAVCKRGIDTWWRAKTLGYDSVFGYYISPDGCWANNGSLRFEHSKDAVNNGTEYSAQDLFLNGKFYSTIVSRKSATGLVAYSQKFPVFINGKCKYIESQEIPLKPSCDNYIYITGKDDSFKIEARQRKDLLSGENSFNTILIAKITTDAADPVSIEYYEVI